MDAKTLRSGAISTGFLCLLLLVLAPSPAQAVTMTWNTFMGSTSTDEGKGIAVDGSGNLYVMGHSNAAWGNPINLHTGGYDVFVAKFDSSGSLVWNTFMGSASSDSGYGIAASGSDLYVTGESNATWGSPKNSYAGGGDAFVAKLADNGSLVWNTFLGSANWDSGYSIAVDGAGLYVTGKSMTAWGSPKNSYAGGWDAFVAKLADNGSLVWNTFLGSGSDDWGYGIAASGSGVYVTGDSNAAWGSPKNSYAGGGDAFVAKLADNGSLVWNTFMGSASTDMGRGIAIDGSGLYVTGFSYVTWGEDPINLYAGGGDAFAAKLSDNGTLVWNTFLGSASTNPDYGRGIAIDGSGLYVTGDSYETWGSPINQIDPYTGTSDAFVAKLADNGSLVWNTFMGSESVEEGRGIAVGGSGLYVTGLSSLTWGSPLNFHAGGQYDAFVAKFKDCLDADGDGYGTGPGCPGIDCNDADNKTYPGATETCNGKDDDCDNQTDEGYVSRATTCGVGACAATGSTSCATGREENSCRPGTPTNEVAGNGIDDDCDGQIDEGGTACVDNDGDGYFKGEGCTPQDCDDTDDFLYEVCPDCEVTIIPSSLGWLLGEKKKSRRLIVIGPQGKVFDENTPVRWETDAITVLSNRIFFKRFMLMKVSIDGAALDKGEYRALIGDCSAKLTMVK